MNLLKFLKEVENITNVMSKNELVNFVYDNARTLPKDKRDAFLYKLSKMQGGKSENKEAFCELRNSIYCKYKYIKDKLISIKNGELYLIGYPNEEYNEWSNSNENEFIYEDPQGVVTVIDEACNLLHQCIHCK